LTFFFFFGTGVWTQGLTFARQALLPLEPLSQPLMGFLEMGLANYFPGAGLEPWSSWSLPPE
jgi:hypothetical protein